MAVTAGWVQLVEYWQATCLRRVTTRVEESHNFFPVPGEKPRLEVCSLPDI